MNIAAAVAADLAALADATGDGGAGLRDSLDGLRRDARAAVRRYLGLSVTVAHPDGPLTLQVLEPSASSEDVLASLHLRLSPLYGARPGSTLTLYAGRDGAFDGLAADLRALTGEDGAAIVIDSHLGVPDGSDGPTLADTSAINQAIGVLHERGFGSLPKARAELARLALRDGLDLAGAARELLQSVIQAALDSRRGREST